MGAVIEDDRVDQVTRQYRVLQTQQDGCAEAWDGTATVRWETRFGSRSFTGYVQLLAPSYLKLVVANPLGQPLWLAVANGRTFRSIDVSDKSVTTGNLRSFVARSDLPLAVLEYSWFDWLSGRLGRAGRQPETVREDSQGRGVWVSFAADDEGRPSEHLLVDPDEPALRGRLLLDELGDPALLLFYDEWQPSDGCAWPTEVRIIGVRFGTTATVAFTEIAATPLTPNDFTLPLPPGFATFLMP